MKKYIPFHLHSTYSILDGVIRIKDLVDLCLKNGISACGVTDHANLSGAVELYTEAKQKGIKPIIGCEVNTIVDEMNKKEKEYSHLILLVKNSEGWQNLTKITHAGEQFFYYRPRVPRKFILENSKGLICTSACINGDIAKSILEGDLKKTEGLISDFKTAFGDDFYLEIQNHNIEGEKEVNERILELAKKFKVKVVFQPDAHYLLPEDREIEKICVKLRTSYSDFELSGDNYHVFQEPNDIPEEAFENTFEIAEKVQTDVFNTHPKMPRVKSTTKTLDNIVKENLKRIPQAPEYLSRLSMEMEVIKKLGFADYFVLLYDIMSFARKNKIGMGVGRGSAAGSLLAYILGITQVDPIQYKLLFERFLNPEKVTLPDIDIDIEDERRQEVIDYVASNYDVVQIITFSRFAGKSQVNDLKRLGVPDNKINEYADKMSDLVRHVSIHPSGIVILPDDHNLPVTRVGDTKVSQFDMESIDKLGFVKFDFLGLKTVSLLVKIFGDNYYEKIPLDDRDVYEKIFWAGDTTGVFQMESEGMRKLLRAVKPQNIEELATCNALYRPGTLNSGLVDKYINGEPMSKAPEVIELLKETKGVLVYQEQVMMIAHKLGKLTMPETDILRKAISKKKIEEIENFRSKFIQNASEIIGEEEATALFNTFVNFGEYAFNKSHSVSYAIMAYYTAYAKLHHPMNFYRYLIQTNDNDPEYIQEIIYDAFLHDIEILPPDIAIVDENPIIKDNKIMLGIANIKGVDVKFAERIKKAKQRKILNTWDDVKIAVNNDRIFEIITKNCYLNETVYTPSEQKLFILSEKTTIPKLDSKEMCYVYSKPTMPIYEQNRDSKINTNIENPPPQLRLIFNVSYEVIKKIPQLKFLIAGKLYSLKPKENNKKYKYVISLKNDNEYISILLEREPNVSIGEYVAVLCQNVLMGESVMTVGNMIYTLESAKNLFNRYVFVFDESDEEVNYKLELLKQYHSEVSNENIEFCLFLRNVDGEWGLYQPNPPFANPQALTIGIPFFIMP